jgi:gluconate 2-dehydrogenase gamma chain
MSGIRRRDLITGATLMWVGNKLVRGRIVSGQLPWHPDAGSAPQPVRPGPWLFFTESESVAMGALADRIIPPDPQTPGGHGAGCVVFIDRQLSGPYGKSEGHYIGGPFHPGSKEQGPQSAQTPAELYRTGLAALDRYCRSGKADAARPNGFAELNEEHQDAVLAGLEASKLQLEGVDGHTFFEQLLKDVQEGFFADPVYGGNRDMCAWKMIGFPGARYDYTDWVGRHNQRYPYPPVSIAGRPDWNPSR